MERQPLVSVIIPVYNSEQYLSETLDSVLATDYANFEVIVMDDGSKDASIQIAQKYADNDSRVKLFSQPNGGVCKARNNAIKHASGEYIFPVDSDDLINPDFIRKAVNVISKDNEIKAVFPRIDFFGDREGEWKLRDFSIRLLARKNILPACAVFRKTDWEKAGGYDEEIIAREDWEFWISVLKNGGKIVKLPEISVHYRIRQGSKRVSDRALKRHVIAVLNKRHPEFFERELRGPLRFRRTWSRLTNTIYRLFHPRKVFVNPKYADFEYFVKTLPIHFCNEDGRIVHNGRNVLREFDFNGKTVVVKSFCKPNFINRIAYGLFRSSKAQRSYEYADLLLGKGIGSPEPVAYMTERCGLLFTRSYYVSMKSECEYTYTDLVKGKFENEQRILEAIAHTTAKLHNNGMIHRDYSRGNILFHETQNGVNIEIIDLNRIRFHEISLEEGCQNFNRLPNPAANREQWWKTISDTYAKERNLDADKCYRAILEATNDNPYNQLG